MGSPGEAAFELTQTYAFLEDGGAAPLVRVSDAFWKDLLSGNPSSADARRVLHGSGWLVSVYKITRDAPGWEMHPLGDELLVMLSGEMGVVLQHAGAEEETVELRAGRSCIVPRGTWHRQVMHQPGEYLGATYGKGTQHRAR